MKKLNWDLKKIQGILKRASMENKNFEECLREEAEFWEQCHKRSGGDRAQQNNQSCHGQAKSKRGW